MRGPWSFRRKPPRRSRDIAGMKRLPRTRAASRAKRTPARPDDALYARVLDIVEAARKHAARSVNSAMVHAYWMIGREIVIAEQAGARRAGYGEEVIERLSERLTRELGKGYGPRTLWRLRQFYQLYPKGSAVAGPAILTEARTES
jgi:aryl-alcohol dehydrogenase-like predicted oxidoreductase